MLIIRKRAFARAGLLGNPSDGYGGRTISISVRNYWAEVVLYEWDSVEIVLADDDRNIRLHERNFSIRYRTTIPRQVGLAGSSAIIVATLRCLLEFYGVSMPIEVQPTFVLQVEQLELGITVGLQDRVIQAYEGLVYMDFGAS